MKNLRTVEDVFAQDGERLIYAIAALPTWAHYDPKECPAPIRAWIQQHCPDVVIEELSGNYSSEWKRDNCDPSSLLPFPTPIFRLGFNAQQAEHFAQVWSTLPPDSPDMPEDFYFVTYDFRGRP